MTSPDDGRRKPEAGRRTPEAGRRTTDDGRRTTHSGRQKRTKLCLEPDVYDTPENVTARSRLFAALSSGEALAILSAVAVELLVGRALAIMRHPLLAWPRLPPSGRVVLAAGYAGVSYLAVFVVLQAL